MAAKREKPTLPTDTDWPAETVTWFNAWRDDRCSDRWDERQWQYVMDTAIVHALVYGSNDFGALAELDKRLRFHGPHVRGLAMNDQNLIKPKRDQTPEQRRAAASKAGKAAAKKRPREEAAAGDRQDRAAHAVRGHRRRAGRAGGDVLRGLPRPRKLTVSEISVLKVARKAMKGDIAALQFLRDTAGEKPSRRSRWQRTCRMRPRRSAS